MGRHVILKSHVEAEIRPHTNGDLALVCQDPLYVRSEALVLDHGAGTLHVVVDGTVFDLGVLAPETLAALQGRAHLLVSAAHFEAGTVGRKVDIVAH